MAPKSKEQKEYEKKSKAYRKEVSDNKQRNKDIEQHKAIRAELEEKIQRLEDAKAKIDSENAQFFEAMRTLNKDINYELFEGKNEVDYTSLKQTPAIEEARKFINGINGDGNSVIQQINSKLSELRASVDNENSIISSTEALITHPVAPKPPAKK